eukprot:CAMPEP_0119301118 /NCGR_PEP_ID=MMETSP1333-20130426/2945_1 /TAXON_ID=418940 /ORGANISM="Scyphosphaera apsteinii, Strain RCC1455" /LENGTH=174 /DNA_ID=CAMNT_0007303105 /DNA_START=279 /DNA_END=804 /DNA_ORIENTATION=-
MWSARFWEQLDKLCRAPLINHWQEVAGGFFRAVQLKGLDHWSLMANHEVMRATFAELGVIAARICKEPAGSSAAATPAPNMPVCPIVGAKGVKGKPTPIQLNAEMSAAGPTRSSSPTLQSIRASTSPYQLRSGSVESPTTQLATGLRNVDLTAASKSTAASTPSKLRRGGCRGS